VELLVTELSDSSLTLPLYPNIVFTFGFLYMESAALKFVKENWILGLNSH
jgi:hypothetical protein